MTQPVKIRIRNQEYLLQGDDREERILRLAQYVNEKLKEVEENTEGLSEKKAAILAALNIASDYFQLIEKRDELLSDIRERTRALIQTIDSTMSWVEQGGVRSSRPKSKPKSLAETEMSIQERGLQHIRKL